MDASNRLQQLLRVIHEPAPARKATREKSVTAPVCIVAKPAPVAANAACVMTYDSAALLMWNHYKDRRAQYITDIRLYREHILAAIMCGIPEEAALEPYLKPLEDVTPVPNPRRRAA